MLDLLHILTDCSQHVFVDKLQTSSLLEQQRSPLARLMSPFSRRKRFGEEVHSWLEKEHKRSRVVLL